MIHLKKIPVLILPILAAMTLSATAYAATGLTSLPLLPGDGGFYCLCKNISKADITVRIEIERTGFSPTSFTPTIPADEMDHIDLITMYPSTCNVYGYDTGKVKYLSINAKKVSCTFFSLDTNGNPLSTVPVDIKKKSPK